LGKIQIPLLSDLTHQMSKDYGVFLQDVGHALRYELNEKNFCAFFIDTFVEDYLLLMVVVFFVKLQ
jgi:hypothetical protein